VAEKYRESPLGADAEYQLGELDYSEKKYESALGHFKLAVDNVASNDQLAEKSLYKMGWSQFRLDQLDAANKTFGQLIERSPNGVLVADARYMMAESLFKQEKFEEAFEAFRVAQPMMEASQVIERENVWLGKLHAAQAANKIKKFDEARTLASTLVADENINQLLRYDASLELGLAEYELGNRDGAMKAWKFAAAEYGATGARAGYQMGAVHFVDQEFEKAIQEFSLVKNGYGGRAENPDVDPWQALASYEIGRCLFEQAKQTNESNAALRTTLINDAKEAFLALKKDYPDDLLVPQAEEQIKKLDQLLKNEPK
jgi:TolA-binding protein